MYLSPHRVSKARRADLHEFLQTRNATTGQIARRAFPSHTPETARKKASRWLAKERQRKRVHVRGIIRLRETGRPELVYGQPCPVERLEHEVWVTEAELLLEGRFQRNVPVGKTTADGLLIRDEIRFYVEVDNETETNKQLRQKWLRYGDLDGYILVICHTEGRLQRLLESAERVKNVALFSRFCSLSSPCMHEPWIDCYGKRTRI